MHAELSDGAVGGVAEGRNVPARFPSHPSISNIKADELSENFLSFVYVLFCILFLFRIYVFF